MFAYHFESFSLFMDAIPTLIILSLISFVKKEMDFQHEYKAIKREINLDPSKEEQYGDINDYLERHLDIQRPNWLLEIRKNILHPLLVIVLINLFDYPRTIELWLTIFVILLTFYYEFVLVEQPKIGGGPIIIIVLLWIFLFFSINYKVAERSSISKQGNMIENQNRGNEMFI
jgi:hypothetical protein